MDDSTFTVIHGRGRWPIAVSDGPGRDNPVSRRRGPDPDVYSPPKTRSTTVFARRVTRM